MKTATLLSTVVFASVAWAANPLIPDGISSGCSAFMTTLNTDATLAKCATSLSTATKSFAPGSKSSNSSVTTALGSLCGSGSGCSNTAIRAQLTGFYSACQAELTGENANDVVKNAYDILYVFIPLRDAVCSQDSATGKWCALSASSLSSGSNSTSLANTTSNAAAISSPNLALVQDHLSIPVTSGSQKLYSRASSGSLAPNATTYKTTFLPYLFMLPTSTAAQLCTPCGKSVLSAYVTWENLQPYAMGLANSGILGGQLELWNSVNSKCGPDFLTAVTSNAGAAPLGALSGAINVKASMATASMVGLVAAGLTALVM